MTEASNGHEPAMSPDEAFDLLGNETRLAILRALWNHTKDVGLEIGDPLSFSELLAETGVADSGNFNYHLDRLVGQFVERTDEGYRIRRAGVIVVRSVLAGTVTSDPTFGPVEVDASCPRCDGSVRVEYRNERAITRCTDCEGVFGAHDHPEGTITALTFPPAALLGRGPDDVFRAAHRWFVGGIWAVLDGLCPGCSSTVTLEVHPCPDHDASDGSLCPHCGMSFPAPVVGVCDVCADYRVFPAAMALLDHPEVSIERGEREAGPGRGFPRELVDPTTWDCEVSSEDPVRLAYAVTTPNGERRIELGGDVDVGD